MTYGFSGLNKNLNSNRNNGFNIGTALKTGTIIIPARVISIILDESHPKFLDLGEWNALGAIEYELVENPNVNQQYSIAYPLSPNVKNYPLINEVVYLISLPNDLLGETNVSKRPYYINIVSLWNHPHHNAYPSLSNESDPPQQKDYIQTQAGSTKIVTDNNKKIFLGKTFEERSNIHPLLPFEGDVIQEGRWGNSIRFGSTITNPPSSTIINNWSETGKNGDPIVIIRNGQGSQTDEGWLPITENVDNDDSSIYLTSTQKIPLTASSKSYISYSSSISPDSPNEFSGRQILLNSGRLVFNAGTDHILLSAAKSINLNSQNSVNIDTKDFTVQSEKIYLGSYDANEPLLKGNLTVDVLKNLIKALKQLNNTFTDVKATPITTAPGLPTTLNPVIIGKATTLNTTLIDIENQLKDLTSKYNYTV
jgi:hypothetical protein